MLLSKNRISVVVKIAVLIWGVLTLIEGAGLEFFMRESDPFWNSETIFSNLVYLTLFFVTLLSFLSTWIASLVLLLSAVSSLGIWIWTNSFGHGVSWADPLLLDIALRPALGALVLFVLSRWVKDPPVTERLRSWIRK